MPRSSKLTPKIQETIELSVAGGAFFETACEMAGIGSSTGYAWLKKGEAGKSPYREFREAIKKAEAYAESTSLTRIRQAARGGLETKSEVVEKFHPDGTLKERIERKTLQPPDWTADAWYLERKHKDRWARTQTVKTENINPTDELAEMHAAENTLFDKLGRLLGTTPPPGEASPPEEAQSEGETPP